MVIHTKDLIKTSKLKFLDERKNMKSILKIKDKIVIFLKREIKNTKEIEKELNLKPRTTRRVLFDLEKEKLVKRIRMGKIRRKLGESDSWKLINQEKILKKVPKNKICVFYKTFHKNNIYKKHYFILPKKLYFNENFLSALGFFQAEGSKKMKSVEIVNSELNLIKLFLKFLKHFNIKEEKLRFRITLNKKILKKSKINGKNLEKNAKKFWDKVVDSSIYKYGKINYTGASMGNLRKNTPKQGSLSIEYCNTVFRLFLNKLIIYVKNNLLEKKAIIAYLRGFFAGEAYVGEKDREIQLASTDLDELKLVKDLLTKININCSISKKTSTSPPRIILTNLRSFLLLEDYNIFKFHPIKKRSLLIKILNYKTPDQKIRKHYNKKLIQLNELIQKRICP